MPQHATPRQPLSCENCRKRKIKCSGGSIPCHACVRRGYPQSCYFKRFSGASLQGIPDASELLRRIQNLEELVERQSPNSVHDTHLSETSDAPARSYSSSASVVSEVLPMRSSCKPSGTIVTSPSGHQHFSSYALTTTRGFASELPCTIPTPASTTSFPFMVDSVGSREVLLDILPSLRHCDELKAVFFQVFSPLFHILHDPTFDAVYETFRNDTASVSLSWLALLFVILAVAVTALDENNSLLQDLGRGISSTTNLKKLSAKYRSAAMQCLTADQFLYQHNLQTVQALILLLYAMNHANIPSWALLGTTWNIAVRIGCHIDPSLLNLGIIEGEERRRCWAALMMLYSIQNTCLGIVAPQLSTTNVQLPADMDDDDIKDDQLFDDSPHNKPGLPTKMSYILYKFRLYKIAADISQTSIHHDQLNEQMILALDRQLASEEQEHVSRFSGQKLPTYHIAHHCILQSYTHHLYLVLHRPMLSVERIGQGTTLQSQQRCKTSAITILEVHRKLYETEAFRPYQWYVYGLGSFHAFLAASVLIALLCKPNTLTDSDHLRFRTLVEQCMQRFETMAGRSDICARAGVILRQILPKSNHVTAFSLDAESDPSMSISPRDIPHQHQHHHHQNNRHHLPDPAQYSEHHQSLDLEGWNLNPGLEALLFDAAPQQWLAPSSFMWSHWDNTALV